MGSRWDPSRAARQAGELLRVLERSLRLVWAADPPRAATYLLVTAALGLLPVASAWLSKLVLDRVGAAFLLPGDAALANAALAAAAGYVGLRFLGRLLAPVGQQLGGNLQTIVTGHAQRRLLAVGAAIPDLDHFERKEFQDELALLEGEISWRPKAVLEALHALAQSPLSILGLLALLWRVQPLLALALLAATVPQVIAQRRLQVSLFQSLAARSEAGRRMAYCAQVTTEPGAAKELLVFGVGPWFAARWRRLADAATAELRRLRRQGLRSGAAVVALDGLVLAGGYAYVAAQVGAHRLTIGDFALYLSAVLGLQQALAALTTALGGAYGDARFMRRLFAFLDGTRPSIALAPADAALPTPARLARGIELRDLRFAYPGQARLVLDGVTCELRAGETVALVGENGAGKTTLVKLLTRLYDPTDGAILLDGRPIERYDLASLRQRIGVLFQDFAHFALTAQENVGVGDVRHIDDAPCIAAAARWAGADAVLAKLPRGPATPLTRTFAGGVELSGGEWQKIATARAAMRDAVLLILDEPTAALDAEAEYALFTRFRTLAAGRTVLLISHRFSTVRMADRILVLDGGRIVEAGTHAELTARGGRYAEMYALQAGRYR